MTAFLARRFLRLFLVWWGISLITFLLLGLTGDPARVELGELATDEAIAQYRHERGLDRPWYEQYGTYMSHAIRGDLGRSWRFGADILPMILERFPATVQLGGMSLLISLVAGVSLGMFSAVHKDSALDYIARGAVVLAQGIPNFYLAILLILLFSVELHLLPTGGVGDWKHAVMPTAVLSLYLAPVTVRVARASVRDILEADYLRTARAKGLRERTVMLRHVLPNALLPILSVVGVQAAYLFSGAIITETVFSWPGMGRLLISAVMGRDFRLVQGIVLVIATLVVAINMIVDILYGVIDPRLRES
jgi:peptide/nickel transport system permease protein